jgi:hypothetical protein
MRFDPSGLDRAFDVMSKRAKKGTKTLATKQGWFFVRMARKISFANAPDPMTILGLEQKLGGRLRRKKGVTVPQEIGRRILMIGTLARNWRFWKSESGPGWIRLWIIDNVKYSKVVDDRQHLAEQAAKVVRGSFKKGLNKLAAQITKGFGHG